MGHGQRVQFKKVIYKLHLSNANIAFWPGKAVCMHCSTQSLCLHVSASVHEQNRIRPCKFHQNLQLPTCSSGAKQTHITRTQQTWFQQKKDKNTCSFLCAPLCTLTQSLKRGLGNSLPADTQNYNSFKHK